ncbi:hypothetical protein T484DRAFT_1851607 [Baffinella frigidus]|nr:hypothetical protein T484DRAFT_1851607 [Cryptophyta sp. CCMP2293]
MPAVLGELTALVDTGCTFKGVDDGELTALVDTARTFKGVDDVSAAVTYMLSGQAIGKVVGMDDVSAAVAYMLSGQAIGKVVVEM